MTIGGHHERRSSVKRENGPVAAGSPSGTDPRSPVQYMIAEKAFLTGSSRKSAGRLLADLYITAGGKGHRCPVYRVSVGFRLVARRSEGYLGHLG